MKSRLAVALLVALTALLAIGAGSPVATYQWQRGRVLTGNTFALDKVPVAGLDSIVTIAVPSLWSSRITWEVWGDSTAAVACSSAVLEWSDTGDTARVTGWSTTFPSKYIVNQNIIAFNMGSSSKRFYSVIAVDSLATSTFAPSPSSGLPYPFLRLKVYLYGASFKNLSSLYVTAKRYN